MKITSLTIIRNKKIVGRNSKSYNDKHPENHISLRPIHDAIKATRAHISSHIRTQGFASRAHNANAVDQLQKINRWRNLSRPAIACAIANMTLR